MNFKRKWNGDVGSGNRDCANPLYRGDPTWQCHAYTNTGRCWYGDECKYLHQESQMLNTISAKEECANPRRRHDASRCRAEEGEACYGLVQLELTGNGPYDSAWVDVYIDQKLSFHSAIHRRECDLLLRLRTCADNKVHLHVQDAHSRHSVTRAFIRKGTKCIVSTACPACGHHLLVKCTLESHFANEPESKKIRAKRGAYVSVLWGTKPACILDALVLGWSLMRSNTCHDRILLITKDVKSCVVSSLLKAFWQVQEVEHVRVHRRLVGGCKDKFTCAFTKFRAFELYSYGQVVLLDGDTLVRRNIDELLTVVKTPAAFIRGHHDARCGPRRAEGTYFDKSGRLAYGINAGVLVFSPDSEEAKAVFHDIENYNPAHTPETAPEQAYLSKRYAGQWEALPMKYNYQTHQLCLAAQKNGVPERLRMNFEDASIVHYSSEFKPSNFAMQDGIPDMNEYLSGCFTYYKCNRDSKKHSNVRQQIYTAFAEWNQAASDMYEHLLSYVVQSKARNGRASCVSCGKPHAKDVQDLQHAFFDCPKTAGIRAAAEKWQNGRIPESSIAAQRLLDACKPGLLWSALEFVATVHSARSQFPTRGAPTGKVVRHDMVPWRGQRPHGSDKVFDHKVLSFDAAVLHTTENRMKTALSLFCYEHSFHDPSVCKLILNNADVKRWLLDKARMVLPAAAFCQLQSFFEDQSQAFRSQHSFSNLFNCAVVPPPLRHPSYPHVAQNSVTLPLPMIQPLPSLNMSLLNQR